MALKTTSTVKSTVTYQVSIGYSKFPFPAGQLKNIPFATLNDAQLKYDSFGVSKEDVGFNASLVTITDGVQVVTDTKLIVRPPFSI